MKYYSAITKDEIMTSAATWMDLLAKSLHSCPTLFDPMDHSLPGSSVHGIFQTRILEWVSISSSRYECI